LGLVLAATLLSACKGGGAGTFPLPIAQPPAAGWSRGFVDSFASYETVAASLRDGALRYTIQTTAGWFFADDPGTTFDSYPLAAARAEYAHATGLTGLGQTIAIVDDGFRTTHEALAGRPVTTVGALPVADHGTFVASVAAGDGPTMIGIAPDAGLLLGSFATPATLAAATNAARDAGAVVQNNSWGYVAPATQAGFDLVFGGPGGADYLSALADYADTGVVVFALSNDGASGAAQIMDGLPILRPALESGWLAVGNAVPDFDNTGVQGATLISAPCGVSAAWCLVADGAWTGATAAGDSAYDFMTGSSFAAPQVAGAMALLAEAFPDLAPHDLRLRLISSADNGFFTPDGVTQITPDLAHGWSTIWGHGFLDLRAALLPIGTVTLVTPDPVANGTADAIAGAGPAVPAMTPRAARVATGAAMGDALTQSLAAHRVALGDSLGGRFTMPAAALAAPHAPLALGARLRGDAGAAADAGGAFAAWPGQSLTLAAPGGGTSAALLVPADAGAPRGLSVLQTLGDGPLRVALGLTVARDHGQVIGLSGADGRAAGTDMAALRLVLSGDLAGGGFVQFAAETGIADMAPAGLIRDTSAARFDSFALTLGRRDVARFGDRLTLGVALPIAVTRASARITLPVTRAGVTTAETLPLNLAPADRQVDLTLAYHTPIGDTGEASLQVIHAINHGHRAGQRDTAIALGWRMRF
jgi:hypothetical protein